MILAYDDLAPALRQSGLISSEEAAAMLECSVKYLYNKVARHVRGVRIGRSVFWRTSDIERFKATHPRVGKNRKNAA